MKEEKDYVAKILAITTRIKQEHPELYPFLEEMAVTLPDVKDPNVDAEKLEEYYEFLIDLLDKYNIAHEQV